MICYQVRLKDAEYSRIDVSITIRERVSCKDRWRNYRHTASSCSCRVESSGVHISHIQLVSVIVVLSYIGLLTLVGVMFAIMIADMRYLRSQSRPWKPRFPEL